MNITHPFNLKIPQMHLTDLHSTTTYKTPSTSSPTPHDTPILPFTLTQTPPFDILLISEPTPFTHTSGYTNRYLTMLDSLKKAGDKVSVITTCNTVNPPKVTKEGYSVAYTKGFMLVFYPVTVTFDLPDMQIFRHLLKLRSQNKLPDLIHCTTPGFVVFLSILNAQLFNIPLVLTFHTHLPHYMYQYAYHIFPSTFNLNLYMANFFRGVGWWLARLTHGFADLSLVTSDDLRREFYVNGVERVEVWRKGIDSYKFNPDFKRVKYRKEMTVFQGSDYSTSLKVEAEDKFVLVYVGRLDLSKRILDLVPLLKALPLNVHLTIIGKGPQDQTLKTAFKTEINQGRVTFMGQLDGKELSTAFAAGDLFVMPSDSETLGFVVLESMASGVPVIAANAGGIPSLVKDGFDGFLCTPGDTVAWFNRVVELMNDKGLRESMSLRGREEAVKWKWEAATSHLRNVHYVQAVENFEACVGGRHRLRRREEWGWGRWAMMGAVKGAMWAGILRGDWVW